MSEVNGMSSIQQFSASTPSAFLIWVTCGGWPSGRSWWLWVAHLILQLVWTTCSSNSRWWSAPKSGSHSFPVSSIYIYCLESICTRWMALTCIYIYIYSHHVQSIWGLGFVHLDDHVDSNTAPWPGDMFWECQMFSWYQSIFHYIYIYQCIYTSWLRTHDIFAKHGVWNKCVLMKCNVSLNRFFDETKCLDIRIYNRVRNAVID